uniref:cysteine synthase n=1 Tax=candidate division CPR3 bacterium TaxID=2268181 RepID=A0A7C4QWT2_UNCC3
MKYENILETIGNTPLIKINNIIQKPGVEIYAKIEGVNPGGSVKDRIALRMIEEAEKSGKLTKEKTIIEATSGNTGIAIAMIAAVKGYSVEIVMSDAVSIERQKVIKSFGAKITLTEGQYGTDGAIRKVHELVSENPDKYFHTDQFSNEYNKAAHYSTTAKEIWDDLGDKIDYFVAAIGTSGTLMGVSDCLKEYKKDIKVVSGEPVAGHYIQGLKSMDEAIIPSIYDKSKLDDIIKIDTEEAFRMAREIIQKEGIFVGMSAGAAMLTAKKVAEKIDPSTTLGTSPVVIVTIFPDRGDKYLSTKLFDF